MNQPGQAIGFKEWQVVCDALASGRQSLILRKGGIHEGRDGFAFAHEEFFLFPTKFHAQLDQVREGEFTVGKEWEPGDDIEITHFTRAKVAKTIKHEELLKSVRSFHIYADDLVKERFDWSGKGMSSGSIHCAVVEVFELSQAWIFPYEKKFGGCRSWLTLPEPPEDILKDMKLVSSEAALTELQNLLV